MDRPKPDRILVVARDPVRPLSAVEMRRLMQEIERDGPETVVGCGAPVDLYQRIDGVWEHVWSGPDKADGPPTVNDANARDDEPPVSEHFYFDTDRIAFKIVQDPATGEMVRLDDGAGNIVREDPRRSRDDGTRPFVELQDQPRPVKFREFT